MHNLPLVFEFGIVSQGLTHSLIKSKRAERRQERMQFGFGWMDEWRMDSNGQSIVCMIGHFQIPPQMEWGKMRQIARSQWGRVEYFI
jgi:hypothetical protein